jgi:galactose-1-phosphate uridylyltransferase
VKGELNCAEGDCVRAMSEIRQDITTEEWVIMARERAKRPHDFENNREDRLPVPAFLSSCPLNGAFIYTDEKHK